MYNKELDNLKEEIETLIARKCEGAYWDFKLKWYEKTKNCNLLHDIICMANNLENRNAYIIIGVSNKEFKIEGINKDPNRKNTDKLCCFIKDAKFAGGLRPSVLVRTLDFDGKSIDVIVIENSTMTPFFLAENYNKVKAGHIYTRINDTNTSTNSIADMDKIEYLWKKRFAIDKTALEKLYFLLKNSAHYWRKSDVNSNYDEIYYHELYPEFTLRLTSSEEKDLVKLYMLSFLDKTPHWFEIEIYYHQTMIKYFSGVYLDGCRYTIVAPSEITIDLEYKSKRITTYFFYYVEDSLEFLLSILFLQNNTNFKLGTQSIYTLLKDVLFFKNATEFNNFIYYLTSNTKSFFNKINNTFYAFSNEQQKNEIKVLKQIQAHYLKRYLDPI